MTGLFLAAVACLWLSLLPSSCAVIVVDLRDRRALQEYDPRETRGFTDWSISRRNCADTASPAATASSPPIERLGSDPAAKADFVACLTQRHDTTCASIGGECVNVGTPESAVSKRARDYFTNPPARDVWLRHFRRVQTATAKWRGVRMHSYGAHDGPWVENHWIRRFWSKPADYWYPLIPIFIQKTDTVFHGKLTAHARMLDELFTGKPFEKEQEPQENSVRFDENGKPLIETDWGEEDDGSDNEGGDGTAGDREGDDEDHGFAWAAKLLARKPKDYAYHPFAPGYGETPSSSGGVLSYRGVNYTTPFGERYFTPGRPLLREQFLYVMVSQHDVGPLAAAMEPRVWRNVFVFSAGGWGNVPIPLLTQGSCVLPSASSSLRRSHLLSFAGRVDYQSLVSGVWGVLRQWRQALMADIASKACFPFPVPSQSASSSDHSRRFNIEEEEEQLPLPAFMRGLSSSTSSPPSSSSSSSLMIESLLLNGTGLSGPAADKLRCALHLQPFRKNGAWRDLILDSALSVALRGVGSTSFRMYETLAMGRIPLYLWHYLTWLPYGNSKVPLWGPSGVALVLPSEGAATFVERDLQNLLAPLSKALQLQDREMALKRELGEGNSSFSVALQAASRELGIKSLQHHLEESASSASPSFELHRESALAQMEARLQVLHGRYFTYDAVMDHIELYLKDSRAGHSRSELHCMAKPHVLTDKRKKKSKEEGKGP